MAKTSRKKSGNNNSNYGHLPLSTTDIEYHDGHSPFFDNHNSSKSKQISADLSVELPPLSVKVNEENTKKDGNKNIYNSTATKASKIFATATLVRYGYTLLVVTTILWGSLCMFCNGHLRYGGRKHNPQSTCVRVDSLVNDVMKMLFGVGYNGFFFIGLAMPLLFTTLIGKLLGIYTSKFNGGESASKPLISSKFVRYFSGDPAVHTWSFIVLVVPTTAICIDAVLSSPFTTMSRLLMTVANPAGTASCIALGFFLVPVAKQSTLLSALGCSPIHALAFHRWAGWVCAFYGSLHAFCYAHGYVNGQKKIPFYKAMYNRMFPPPNCWGWAGPFAFTQQSHGNCYFTWRNFTGTVSVFALLLLSVTSFYWFRRRFYTFFYWTHIVAGTIMLLGAIAHVPVITLYTMPSIVYYIACSSPVLVQQISEWLSSRGAIRLVRTTFIGRSNGCAEMVLGQSLQAAIRERAQPAPYVRICVPEISLVWHPFSVASAYNDSKKKEWRILFRQQGRFTKELYQRLQNNKKPPSILVDAYYFGSNWIEDALQHDNVLIVAGGVGIVPFLSLIHRLYNHIRDYIHTDQNEDSSGDDVPMPYTKRVIIHWYCREEGLADHVMKSQLPFFFEGNNNQFDVENGNSDNSSQFIKSHVDFSFEFHCHITSRHSSKVEITDPSVNIPSCSSTLSTASADLLSSLCEKSHTETFSDEGRIFPKDEEYDNQSYSTALESPVSNSIDTNHSKYSDTEIGESISKLAANKDTMIFNELEKISSSKSIDLEQKSIEVKYVYDNEEKEKVKDLDVHGWSIGPRNFWVSFLVFGFISISGFFLQYWYYTNYTHKYGLHTLFRLYPIYILLGLGVIIPLCVQMIFRAACIQQFIQWYKREQVPQEEQEDDDEYKKDGFSKLIERTFNNNIEGEGIKSTEISNRGNIFITIDVHPGRPLMKDVIEPAVNAEHPGIFLCGPQRLLDDVTKTANKARRLSSLRRFDTVPCAFYTESSDM